MDVSRINQGRIVLRRDRIELATIVHRVAETCEPLVTERHHQLAIELPPDPIVLEADATRLTQVFQNLVTNAAKYTDRGGQITIRAEVEGPEVAVAVHDTGIGIPREKLATVFELFEQVETSLAMSKGGLGIGLALAKRLVEMHGGRIRALSDGVGAGSTFVVHLPLANEGNGPHARR